MSQSKRVVNRYSSVNSLYIKNLMAKTPWKNHGYIDNLIALEKFIRIHPRSFLGSLYYHALKTEYPKEYTNLWQEVNPDIPMPSTSNKAPNSNNEEGIKSDWLKAGGKE